MTSKNKQLTGVAQDAALAGVSVLSVLFLALFVSLAYFLTLDKQIAQREAAVAQMLEENRQAQASQVQRQGSVAGYETEYVPYEPMGELDSVARSSEDVLGADDEVQSAGSRADAEGFDLEEGARQVIEDGVKYLFGPPMGVERAVEVDEMSEVEEVGVEEEVVDLSE
jgi:hypothetical protein